MKIPDSFARTVQPPSQFKCVGIYAIKKSDSSYVLMEPTNPNQEDLYFLVKPVVKLHNSRYNQYFITDMEKVWECMGGAGLNMVDRIDVDGEYEAIYVSNYTRSMSQCDHNAIIKAAKKWC